LNRVTSIITFFYIYKFSNSSIKKKNSVIILYFFYLYTIFITLIFFEILNMIIKCYRLTDKKLKELFFNIRLLKEFVFTILLRLKKEHIFSIENARK